MRFRMFLIPLAVSASLVYGCGSRAPLSPVSMNGSTVSTGLSHHAGSASLASDGAQHLEGVLGPGALYAIDVPASWNGDLVVWVHGYTNPATPVALPYISANNSRSGPPFAI